MNAVEIEAAVAELASSPFDPVEFPFRLLEAFGNNETTIAKLRKGVSNHSDVPGGVLQRNNIHLAVAPKGHVSQALDALRNSAKTVPAKAKFILATDGETLEAEELASGEVVTSEYSTFDEHFGFFLPLAGITTVKEIKDNPIDVRATGRLNKLYIELLKENPEWAKSERRPDLNHFLARLIFCFFAEDTDIFHGESLFTRTVAQMSEPSGGNTHLVLEQIFRAMNIAAKDRSKSDLPGYADAFPYVNGGLFSGSAETPKFSKIARSYLIRAGELNWRQINPDIFGSMIQAVADDEERGSLGMHYTSVPNILKVLNPLFLDDLREQLERAGVHKASLLKLRERMSRIRVFDPACGSGNFLVIAYKEMRAIEGEINRRRNEVDRSSEIHLTNFRGIEIRDFAAEVARLALIIAEFQCDVLYRGPKLALAEFLPLNSDNWIVCRNALRLDWTTVCEPWGAGSAIRTTGDDLFSSPLDQAKIEFRNLGGETYVCGNPPYRGSKWQAPDQKADLALAWLAFPKLAKTTDFVTGWFAKFLEYLAADPEARAAFVATNSICQGQHVSLFWDAMIRAGIEIQFAHTSFKWNNLAAANAGVTVVVVGISHKVSGKLKLLYEGDSVRACNAISPYLIANSSTIVVPSSQPLGEQSKMLFGNMPRDGGHLFVSPTDYPNFVSDEFARPYVKKFIGSDELINGRLRFCLWIEDKDVEQAMRSEIVCDRLQKIAISRKESDAESTRSFANKPHRFVQIAGKANISSIVVPRVSSEDRPYLPVGLVDSNWVIGDRNFALYDAPLWNLALIASRLHWVWIGTVCVRMRTDFSYSNTLGWNTFPVPTLSEQNKVDLTRCAEEILLARERHFPKTIADLYDPDEMPDDLRRAHEKNDETLERIYIGRRFKNDTERLEKLFELYAKMTANEPKENKPSRSKANVGQEETLL